MDPRERPEPPDGARDVVLVVLDSLRYDSWLAASPKVMSRLGPVERRYSYASWTSPSHFNMLMGLLPHRSPSHVYASEYYKEDFARYSERLGVPDIEFRRFLPSLYLPTFLRSSLGYQTCAHVSMPVLNEHTPLNRDFDEYRLMDRHNDIHAMLDAVEFRTDRPTFHLLNVGETHYPYAHAAEDPSEWPRISGMHGVFKRLDDDRRDEREGNDSDDVAFFDDDAMTRLRARQVDVVSHVDRAIERLFDLVPRRTWIIITADHGELFGEAGYFGHGPIAHEKVFEVPFVEGELR